MFRTTLWTVLAVGIHTVYSQMCNESPSTICSHPKVVENIDFKWYQDNQPDDGWHMELGNSAVRLHLAELIQGKLMSYNDDFSEMCGRIRIEHSVESLDGKLYGFNGKKTAYQCFPGKDAGAFECDYSSIGLSKYSDHSVNYLTYSDNKEIAVGIFCFPNGENGWFSMSKKTYLTEDQKSTILEHVKSIGYDHTDVVPMYNDRCTDNSVDASYRTSTSQRIQRIRADRDRRRRLRNRQRNTNRLYTSRY